MGVLASAVVVGGMGVFSPAALLDKGLFLRFSASVVQFPGDLVTPMS